MQKKQLPRANPKGNPPIKTLQMKTFATSSNLECQWVFAKFTLVDPKSEMEIVFLFLRYWRLRHNWNMRNTFVFDGRHGVTAYLRKLKGVLMWQFSLLEQVEILSLVECSSCILAIQHVPLPM